MDLNTTPDVYQPCINTLGEYYDHIPTKSILTNGFYCPCGSRRNQIYKTSSQFNKHIKTKTHQKWLESLNDNKNNHYIENEKNKIIINSQKIIIGQLENKLNLKQMEINLLNNEINIYKSKTNELENLHNNYNICALNKFELREKETDIDTVTEKDTDIEIYKNEKQNNDNLKELEILLNISN